VASMERTDVSHCPIVAAHYFRGRLRASDADDRDLLYRERVFDDVLIREGINAHYTPMSREGERDIDVWLSLEAYEMAADHRIDVAVLVCCDGDYVWLVRKLVGRGIRVMVLGWDFRYQDVNGFERETRTAQILLEETTYPVQMNEVIDSQTRRDEQQISSLFVPRKEYTSMSSSSALPSQMTSMGSNGGEIMTVPSNGSSDETHGIEMVGTISAIKNGYGFITPAIGGENVFFFHADVVGKDFLELKLGEKVEYYATSNERGPCAKSVRVVG
jgi:cold shock CspA family protein